MRKQKVFNRVSAWLLVWTMVLSALAGNVTVLAEEPEEVDMQIGVDADVQIEEDTVNETRDEDIQNEDEGTLTGLMAYTWLDGKDVEDSETGEEHWEWTGVNDGCTPEKEPWMDLRGATWYLAEIAESGEPTPVEVSALKVQKVETASGGDEENVTDLDEGYELSASDEVGEDVENPTSYIKIRFDQTGQYRICMTSGEDNYITVHVDYPFTGFYTKPELSLQTYIEQYEYTTGVNPIYAIIREPEGHTVQLDGENGEGIPCGVSLDWGDNVREGVDYSVKNLGKQENEDYYLYAITIAEDCQKNFALNVATQVKRFDEKGNLEDEWPDSNYLNLSGPAGGLHILWPWDEEDEEMKDFNEIKNLSDKLCKSTQDNLGGQHIYLGTKDEDGNVEQITDESDIKLFYKEESGYIEVTADNKKDYGSIGLCKKEGHEDDKSGMFWFAPKKEGVYKISKEGDGFAIWEVVLGGTYEDDPHKKAFSGCMLTETGYEAEDENGDIWKENRQPAANYWAHGDTVQEVLDKLTGPVSVEVEYDEGEKTIVTIPNTGYYYIAMSCFTGYTDAEAKQKEVQTVTLSKDVKGVIMYSGQDEEVAWSSDEPDFTEGDFWNVVRDDKGDFFCNLDDNVELEDGTAEQGWHSVTLTEKGVYVYSKETVEEPENKEDIRTAEYNWPNLVLDATTGHVPVKLDGQWADQANITVECKCKVDFLVQVCGNEFKLSDAINGEPREVIREVEDDKTGEKKKETVTSVTFKLNHVLQNEVRGAKKATCTEDGYTGNIHCKDCDEAIVIGEVIKATGHNWDAGKVTKEATETEKGVKTYTCQNGCKETKTEELPLLEKKQEQKPQGTKIEDPAGGGTFKVTSDSQAKEPTVEYTAPKKDAKGTVKVLDSVTVDGVVYKVTAIADNAFKGNKKVTKVAIGKNVISIGKNAFSGCAKLKSITVGSGVTKIGDNAFKGCAALTKITLPAKVQKIGKNAFDGCKKLKTITIKSTKLTAKNISKGAFKGLTAKTTIKVPKSKIKAYKKLFQAKGLSKKVKVKA